MKYILMSLLLVACGQTRHEIKKEHEYFLAACVNTCTNSLSAIESFEYHPTGEAAYHGGYECKCRILR